MTFLLLHFRCLSLAFHCLLTAFRCEALGIQSMLAGFAGKETITNAGGNVLVQRPRLQSFQQIWTIAQHDSPNHLGVAGG